MATSYQACYGTAEKSRARGKISEQASQQIRGSSRADQAEHYPLPEGSGHRATGCAQRRQLPHATQAAEDSLGREQKE